MTIFAGENIPHPDPDSPFAGVGTNVHMEQLKDLLLTYNEYNKELGYVQGMSDLLAPIYAVIQDDAIAFWGFQHFMDRMEQNFLRDQSGMRAQLRALDHLVQFMDPKLYAHLQAADSTNFFFFFRMLLVWYKREFKWLDVLRLWETLWTDYLTSSFHLFVALAILEKHRDIIITHLKHFDEVLKYSMLPSFFLFVFCCPPGTCADGKPSQRALGHNRSRVDSHPRRSPLSQVPAPRRDHRQEPQLPRPQVAADHLAHPRGSRAGDQGHHARAAPAPEPECRDPPEKRSSETGRGPAEHEVKGTGVETWLRGGICGVVEWRMGLSSNFM